MDECCNSFSHTMDRLLTADLISVWALFFQGTIWQNGQLDLSRRSYGKHYNLVLVLSHSLCVVRDLLINAEGKPKVQPILARSFLYYDGNLEIFWRYCSLYVLHEVCNKTWTFPRGWNHFARISKLAAFHSSVDGFTLLCFTSNATLCWFSL